MRKLSIPIINMVVLCLAISISSCKKESSISQFRAIIESCIDGQSKTALNETILSWTDGDEIAVYGDAGRGLFSTTLQEPSANAVFNWISGDCGNAPFRAFYPSSLTNDGVHIDIPELQNSVDGSLSGFPMYATSNGDNLSFKNLCGVLKIHLQRNNTCIRSIKVTADSEINGSFSVAYNNGIPTLSYEGYGNTSTTLYCEVYQPIDTGKDFFIFLPPGSYSSLTFTIMNSEGNVCEKTSKPGVSFNIARSQFTSIVFSSNDLVFTDYLPKIGVSLNPTDPVIANIITEDEDTAYIFGVKNSQGQPLYLTSVVIKEHNETNPTQIFFDTLNRPVEFIVSNGVILLLEWMTNDSAALTLIDTNTNEQFHTLVDFSSSANDEKSGNRKSAFGIDTSSTNPRGGIPLSLIVNPIKTLSSSISPKSGKIGHIYADFCGSPSDFKFCWVDVSTYGSGSYMGRLSCSKVGTGHYVYTIPEKWSKHHNLADYCDAVATALGYVCNVSSYTPGICLAISAIMLFHPATAASIPKFLVVCEKVSASLMSFCTLYSGDTPVGGPNIGEYLLCPLVRDLNIEWDLLPLHLFTYAATNTGVMIGPDSYYYGDGNPQDIYFHKGNTSPEITSFFLLPPAPSVYQGYTAIASLVCIPPGSTITMSIEGTDGYHNSISYTVGDDQTYEATLYVPGATYSGVRDVCTININLPNGSTLNRTASLVFY